MIDDNWRIFDYCCWWLCTVLWLMSIDLQECGIARRKIGFLRIFWIRCQICLTKMWYRSNKTGCDLSAKICCQKRVTAKTGMNLKQLWNRKNGCHQVSPFIPGTQAWYQIWASGGQCLRLWGRASSYYTKTGEITWHHKFKSVLQKPVTCWWFQHIANWQS